MVRASILSAVVIAASLGCRLAEPTEPCPPRPLLAAVDVEIREAGTNLPLAEWAQGQIRDGAFSDSLRAWRRGSGGVISRAGGFERAGTYDVQVSLLGYATWQQTGVVVPATACGIVTASLIATLQPSSGAGPSNHGL